MKILQVYKTYLPETFTGVERVIWELAEGGPRFGDEHRVLTLSRHPSPGLQVDSHSVFQAKRDVLLASSGFSAAAIGLYRQLWETSDVVHFHFPWPMMDLLHLSLPHRRRKPAVVTYHSDIVRQKMLGQLYAPLGHWFLNSVDSIVATSPNYVETSRVLHRHRGKVSAIPIGLSDRTPPPAAVLERWKRRFPEPFFLFVGTGRYYKGLSYLMEAAAATRLPVVLAGAIESRDLGAPVPPNVALVGEVDDADREALLDLSLALVLPSHLRAEAFGVALVEACRAGKPMITCELGTGTSFVNRNGVTGIVVPPADFFGTWSGDGRAVV